MAAEAANEATSNAQKATNKATAAASIANSAAGSANVAATSATNAASAANDAASAANSATESATSAASAANEAANGATSATQAANAAAEAANEAAQTANTAANNADEAMAGIDDKVQEAVNERVLAKQYGPASVISASGVCKNVPVAGMKAYGKTQQNLWVNPTASTNGVTVTSNDDGSMTVSGTANANGQVLVVSYALKPGTTYTASGTDLFNIYELDIGFETIATHVTSRTFTTSADMVACAFGFYFESGNTFSGTFRVMLNEGSEAQPWCPPGLTSVSELGVVSAGTNIAVTGDGLATLPHGESSRAIAAIYAKAGAAYTLSFFNTADWTKGDDGATVYIHDEHDKYDGAPSVGNAYVDFGTITVGQRSAKGFVSPYDGVIYFKLKDKSMVADVMVEEGDADSSYSAPASVTPVDLSGHQLRSLPDGTRDVLSVEQAVVAVTFNGSEDENWTLSTADNGNGVANFRIGFKSASTYVGPGNVLCDTLPPDNKIQTEATRAGVLVADGTLYIRLYSKDADNIEGLKAWLTANPTTIIWKLTPPWQTVDLDPITPPAVPATEATLWASSNVTTDIKASLWEPFAEEGGMQQMALIEVAKSLFNFANNAEMKILNAQFADNGVAIRKGNLYVVIAQGPERTEDNLEIVTTKEIPLKANDPQVCLLKTRVGQGNGEFIHETINIPGQDPSFYIRTGSTPNGYELLFVAYIA